MWLSKIKTSVSFETTKTRLSSCRQTCKKAGFRFLIRKTFHLHCWLFGRLKVSFCFQITKNLVADVVRLCLKFRIFTFQHFQFEAIVTSSFNFIFPFAKHRHVGILISIFIIYYLNDLGLQYLRCCAEMLRVAWF